MTVKLIPYIHRTTKEILEAFKQGHKTDKKAKSFTFKGVEFFYAEQQTCYALLTSVDDPLPKVFTDNTLRLKHIEINHDLPTHISITPGVYNGKSLGYKEAVCVVKLRPLPTIFVCGSDFKRVVGLYKKVLAGEFQPTTPALEK